MISFKFNDISPLGYFFSSLPLLKLDTKFDILLCHFGTNGLKGLFLIKTGFIKGKQFTFFHGYDISVPIYQKQTGQYIPLFKSDCIFLPISENWKKKLISLGCDEKNTIVHHMGIDCNKFIFKARRYSQNGIIRITSIARLVEKKGIEYGIKAVSELLNNCKIKIEYNIIGDGPLSKKCNKLIQDLSLEKNIKILGWKKQAKIIKLLMSSHIFLCPSITAKNGNQEGIPVALMEAMAVGMPVVASNHSGIPELVKDGLTGYLVPERDVDALTEKLNKLIMHPELWLEMGREGRKVIEKQFNINKLNKELVEFCNEV